MEATLRKIDDAFQKSRAGMLTNIQHMLVYPKEDNSAYSDYENFATNKGRGPRQEVYGSLENVHNNYHLVIGGNGNGAGHMSNGVSSFDPVFWAHHA